MANTINTNTSRSGSLTPPPSSSDNSASNTSSAAAAAGLGNSEVPPLPEPVAQCIRALEAAEGDTEKFAALFMVPKLIQGQFMDHGCKKRLIMAVGYSFLARLLRSKDSPMPEHKLMYQTVALSILSCFSDEPEIMTHPSILFNLPILLDIINNADNAIYEDNLLVIHDAYQCISAIVQSETGRNSFVSYRGIHYLTNIYIRQNFQHEKAQKLLLSILNEDGALAWSYHPGSEDFNNLMTKLCEDFKTLQDECKFELCEIIRQVLKSCPRKNFKSKDCEWLPHLHVGLKDILFSKISKAQRDPAIRLVAAVVEVSDFQWCLSSGESEKKFFLMLLNLVCIEVIMNLENQKLEDILKNSELLVACYFILESAVGHLVNESLAIDEKQKSQLYTALKNAFTSVTRFIQDIEHIGSFHQPEEKAFVCASIRVLSAWLAEEMMAVREDVYSILPFILKTATDTFEVQKSSKLALLPGEAFSEDSVALMKRMSRDVLPDILRFFLPALCHLITEDKSRKILIDLKIHETLYEYVSYHWTIFDSFRHWLKREEEGTDENVEPSLLVKTGKFEMVNSRYALTMICNILMNLVVLEPEFVDKNPIFYEYLKIIMSGIPGLEHDFLILIGNMSMLGLLILKHHRTRRPSESDPETFKFLSTVTRFLWDAHNTEESRDRELDVTISYSLHWDENLMDIWYLGMQVLCSLLSEIPWIAEFVMDSGWPADLIGIFRKIPAMEPGPKAAFQDLLTTLLRVPEIKDTLYKELCDNDVFRVCQKHQLKDLAAAISSFRQK